MKKGHAIWYLECKEPDRSGSVTAVATELARYKLDWVGVNEVRWNNGDMIRAGVNNYSMGKEMTIINKELDFLYTME